MRSLNELSDSQWLFPAKRSRSILEIDSWMPREIRAISPLVGRLTGPMEGSQCVPGAEPDIKIIVTDQGKGFDFGKTVGKRFTLNPASGHGIQLIKAHVDDIHFERGGAEVHVGKRSRTTRHS
jgi:hypothetical protein